VLDLLLSAQLLIAALVAASLYALVALGLNLVYGTMRLLNVAHGDVVMLGGYGAFVGFSLAGVSPLIALALVAMLAGAVGVAAYRWLFARLLVAGTQAGRSESNSLLLFFGVSVILQNLVALGFTGTPRGYEYLGQVVTFGEVAITGNRLVATSIAAALVIAVWLVLRFHLVGLSVRALIEQREAAAIVGVDIERLQRVIFFVAFATAAAAGALLSMAEQVSPFMGFQLTIAAFVVVIMGGLGNVAGGLVAAVALGVIETYGVALTSPAFRSILLYGVFVAVLLVRPQGIFGARVAVR
jgi:branched-chain amino acid transport system permease protein